MECSPPRRPPLLVLLVLLALPALPALVICPGLGFGSPRPRSGDAPSGRSRAEGAPRQSDARQGAQSPRRTSPHAPPPTSPATPAPDARANATPAPDARATAKPAPATRHARPAPDARVAPRPTPPTRHATPAKPAAPASARPPATPAHATSSNAPEPDCFDPKTRAAFVDPERHFGKVIFEGKLTDPKAKLRRIVNIRAGDPFDLCKLTFLRKRFDRLGYFTRVVEEPLGSKVNIRLHLSPVEHVRHVYIKHNWPLFQDEVLRRIRFRAGTRLPPKNIRTREFARQKRRIQEYLRKEGYFHSDLDIVVEKTKRPHVINLVIKLKKGHLYYLGRLRVQGNRALSTKAIRALFEHRILWWRRAFTTARFKKDLRRLVRRYHKLGYPGVRIRNDFSVKSSLDHKRRRVHINLVVRENKRIRVAFEGNHRLDDDDLRGKLTFNSEGSYDEYEVRQSAVAIQRHYQQSGYFLAAVSAERHRVSPREDRIVFHLQEGPQLRVRSVTFSGNHAYSSGALRDVVKTRVFPRLGAIGLGSGGYITDRQLHQDIKRLRDHYRSHGYLDASVRGSVALTKDAAGQVGVQAVDVLRAMPRHHSTIAVRFVIREGPRYLMGRVTLSGQPKEMTAALRKPLRLKANAYFTRKRFRTDLERLKRVFANHGYPYCLIRGTVRKSRRRAGSKSTAYIEVQYAFRPGPKVHFGQIFLRGHYKTRRSVILRELKFKSGDVFSIARVERARRNLRSLGIFRAARIQFIGLRSRENPVHVLVTITERFDDYGSLEIGVGVSTDNLFFFSLAYRNRNFLGLGKELEIKGEVGNEIQSGHLTYKDPRFFGTRLSFDVTTFVRRELTERLGELLTYGGSISLLHKVTRHLQWYVRYQLKRVRRKENLLRIAPGNDESRQVDRFTNVASIGPTVVWDRRDNPLVPQKGFRLTGSLQVASQYLSYPLRSANFVHLHLSGQGLLPLPGGIVVALGLRYDHGFPFGDSPVLPKVERFFAGGDTTVRGYEEDRLKTEIQWANLPPNGAGPRIYRIKPQGANIRLLANLEVMVPIWKVLSMPILGVIFFDAGTLTNDWQSARLSDVKTSVGAAIRLVTPVGFISLEYAIPFQPSYGTDPTGRTHFNFGFIF